jgi:hypothetical protein
MHLTNYAVNKHNSNFQQPNAKSSEDAQDEGSKRSLHWFMNHVKDEHGEQKANWLWKRIGTLCVRTVLSIMPTLSREYDQHFKSFNNIPYKNVSKWPMPSYGPGGSNYKDKDKETSRDSKDKDKDNKGDRDSVGDDSERERDKDGNKENEDDDDNDEEENNNAANVENLNEEEEDEDEDEYVDEVLNGNGEDYGDGGAATVNEGAGMASNSSDAANGAVPTSGKKKRRKIQNRGSRYNFLTPDNSSFSLVMLAW